MFTKDSIVITKDGFKEIVKVKPNDMVLSIDKVWKKAGKLKKERYSDNIITIILNNGTHKIECTPDTVVYVCKMAKEDVFYDNFKPFKASSIKKGDIVGIVLDKDYKELNYVEIVYSVTKRKIETDVYGLECDGEYIVNNFYVKG